MRCLLFTLKVQADGQQTSLNYRYTVTPSENVNAFKPKKLDDDASMLDLRAALLGAAFHKRFSQLPTNEWCKVVWEAILFYLFIPIGFHKQ